ncbi:MAG: HD domain-containing protein [Desulfobacterales bacterium]|jgi:predicted metal-dependent HD superfamily phosphohydrolase
MADVWANQTMQAKYKPQTPRLKIVDQYIRELFKDELPAGIKYHNAEHTLHPTRGVVAVANRIALAENISEHDRELLLAAAYFHDTGYIREYDKNEPIAARMAGRILKLIGYKPAEIKKIQKMILATDLARKPQSLVEKILCDADLDHLGRDDFFKRDGKLRKGRSARGIDVSDEAKWYRGTLNLITNHKYYTASQIKLREEKKQKNIEQLQKKLASIEKRKR